MQLKRREIGAPKHIGLYGTERDRSAFTACAGTVNDRLKATALISTTCKTLMGIYREFSEASIRCAQFISNCFMNPVSRVSVH